MEAKRTVLGTMAGILLLALGATGVARAEGREMGMMMGPMGGRGPGMEMGNLDMMGEMMGMCMRHADRLGLSEDQLAKLRPLHNGMEKRGARFQADRKIAEIELREVMDVKDFDLDKALAAARKLAETKASFQAEMLKSMKEVRTILTEEQFRKMKTMMPMMMEKGPK